MTRFGRLPDFRFCSELYGTAHRRHTPGHEPVERIDRTHFRKTSEARRNASLQGPKPMRLPGARNAGKPFAPVLTIGHTGTNRRDRRLKTTEKPEGPQSDDAFAVRTTISSEPKDCGESVKTGPDETVTPYLVAIAVGADIRPFPRIVSIFFKNFIEFGKYLNYHDSDFWGATTSPGFGAEELWQTLRPFCFRNKLAFPQ